MRPKLDNDFDFVSNRDWLIELNNHDIKVFKGSDRTSPR